MSEHILQFLVPLAGLAAGFIGAYVGSQNRALLAEVRKEIAELENRIIARINGTYVRTGECHLQQELVATRISAVAARIHKAEPPPES